MVICWSHLCCVSKGGKYCNVVNPAWEYQLHSGASPVKQLAFEGVEEMSGVNSNLGETSLHQAVHFGCRLVHQRSGGCSVSEGREKGCGRAL